jgi:hypothetical protein
MVRQSDRHRWRLADSVMDAAEVIDHDEQRNRSLLVSQLFAITVRETSETVAIHADIQVAAGQNRRREAQRR